jgi:predicted alpha/beta hydrolase
MAKSTTKTGPARSKKQPDARAHARSGDAAAIHGYLGKGDVFGKALGRFATTYADQTARDHEALVQAIAEGRIDSLPNV